MKIKLTGIYSKTVNVSLILIILAQITLVAENKKYDKRGIIVGKNAYLKKTLDGKSIKALKEGEVVFVISKENSNSSGWYKIVTVNGNTGWIEGRNIRYLDENKVPDKYYAQILPDEIKDKEYSLYNVKFEFYGEYNIMVYRFLLLDPPACIESMKLYEIKNDRARPVSYNHFYKSKIIINSNYVFVIELLNVTVYNRLQLDSGGDYTIQASFRVPNYESIAYNNSRLDFNKSDNCYYLKIKVGDKYGRNIREDLYKFNGENLTKIK